MIKKVLLIAALLFLSWYFSTDLVGSSYINNRDNVRVFVENFDSNLSDLGKNLVRHRYATLDTSEGVQGSAAIKVNYQGYEHGSHRVTTSTQLSHAATQYQLSFAVKFCDNFDFARGGKLHGLGPKKPVTGGNGVTDAGWSARLMFQRNGGLKTYVYHQDMKGQFGDGKVAKEFRFTPGKYHFVAMRVRLNTATDLANGEVVVAVDGVELIKHENIRFRATNSDESLIHRVLFSTFHGGSSPEWAPKSKDNTYSVECAYFDDFVVEQVD